MVLSGSRLAGRRPVDLLSLSRYAPEKGCVVVLGNFDGVHCGHRALLNCAQKCAEARNLHLYAITFEPHTRHFLEASGGPLLLSSWLEREDLLREAGVDPITLRFDENVQHLSAMDFVDHLIESLDVREFVLGWNHHFGRGAHGSAEALRPYLQALGVGLTVVEPFQSEGVINSTRIREDLVREGGFDEAVKLLGHPWTLLGQVVHGEARGRELGFPTANLEPFSPRKLLPHDGVYAGTLEIPRVGVKPAVINIGSAPTFDRAERLVEAHVPGGPGPAYDDVCLLRVVRFLRGTRAFASVEELREQLQRDAECVQNGPVG